MKVIQKDENYIAAASLLGDSDTLSSTLQETLE